MLKRAIVQTASSVYSKGMYRAKRFVPPRRTSPVPFRPQYLLSIDILGVVLCGIVTQL